MDNLFNPQQNKQPSVEGRTAVAEYLYYDLTGNAVHKTIQYSLAEFTQLRPNPNNPDEWIPELKGLNTIIYNLPTVKQAITNGYPVFIVGGEKDCETLRSIGFTATTCPSGMSKWKNRYSDFLTNAYVYIIANNDASSKRYANKVAASLHGKASQIKILHLTKIVTTLKEKGDVTDVLNILGAQETTQRLLKAMNSADLYNGTVPINPGIFFDRSKFKHDLLAKYMLDNYPIVKIKDQLSIYIDGLYSAERDVFEKIMISIVPTLTIHHRNEVYSYISAICSKRLDELPANFIGLKDYILDINTDNMVTYSPYFVISNRIQYNYNPNAYHKPLDDALNAYACNDPDVRALIEEMVGYTLYRRNELGVAFFLKGFGKNGKSTLLKLIMLLVGKMNCSSLDFKDLAKQFHNIEIVNKLVNIGDDLSDEYISDSSMFKKLVTGDSVTIRSLYEKPFQYSHCGKLIFSCNEMPRVRDKSDGFNRRLIIVPLKAQFDVTTVPNFDPHFADQISTPEAMEYLLLLAIQGLKRILKNRAFTKCAAVVDETQSYVEYNNPLLQFVSETGDLSVYSTKDVYAMYCRWATENNLTPSLLNNIQFGRQLKAQTGYISVPNYKDGHGKSVRKYIIKSKATDSTDGTDNL